MHMSAEVKHGTGWQEVCKFNSNRHECKRASSPQRTEVARWTKKCNQGAPGQTSKWTDGVCCVSVVAAPDPRTPALAQLGGASRTRLGCRAHPGPWPWPGVPRLSGKPGRGGSPRSIPAVVPSSCMRRLSVPAWERMISILLMEGGVSWVLLCDKALGLTVGTRWTQLWGLKAPQTANRFPSAEPLVVRRPRPCPGNADAPSRVVSPGANCKGRPSALSGGLGLRGRHFPLGSQGPGWVPRRVRTPQTLLSSSLKAVPEKVPREWAGRGLSPFIRPCAGGPSLGLEGRRWGGEMAGAWWEDRKSFREA